MKSRCLQYFSMNHFWTWKKLVSTYILLIIRRRVFSLIQDSPFIRDTKIAKKCRNTVTAHWTVLYYRCRNIELIFFMLNLSLLLIESYPSIVASLIVIRVVRLRESVVLLRHHFLLLLLYLYFVLSNLFWTLTIFVPCATTVIIH